MSDKIKYPASVAMPVAESLVEVLRPFCERIQIAGSLRRKKTEVGDIEILFIPRMAERKKDFFEVEKYDMAEAQIDELLYTGKIFQRPNINGNTIWGPKNKLAKHAASGIPVDFFSTIEANWWVSLVIRTGSKETNLKLTNGANARRSNLNAYGCGITMENGHEIAAISERHVFELCGAEYKEPEFR